MRHRLLGRRADLDPRQARSRSAGPDAEARTACPRDVIPIRPVITAHVHYSNLTTDNSAAPRRVQGAARARDHAVRSAGQAQAADLRRRPRQHLGDQSDAAAVRQVGTDQARRRDLLRRGRRLHAAAHLRPAGVAGAQPERAGSTTSSSSAIRSRACRRRSARFETTTSDESEARKYISVEDAKGYLALAQFGVIEFHAWGCHWATALEKPDRVIFDLDPGEGIKFKQIVDAAFFVREYLEGMGLTPYVKTSGGKGLHVVVPLKPKLDWKKAHAATGEIATRHRQGGARDVRGQHVQGQAAEAHLHRLPPQRPQRHGRGALQPPGQAQSAGLDAR